MISNDVSQADNGAVSVDGSQDGIKKKSFTDCPFKIAIPHIISFSDSVLVSFDILSKPGVSSVVFFDEVFLADKIGYKYDSYCTGGIKENSSRKQSVACRVELNGGRFVTGSADIVLYFITDEGRRYEVCYRSNHGAGVSLVYVMSQPCSREELQRFADNLNAVDDPEVEEDEFAEIEQVTEEKPHERIQVLEKYRRALLREKFFLQNEGGRQYRVTNGQLINRKDSLSTYVFELETELNLTDDAPVSLSVGLQKAAGSVLICEGFQIVIVCDHDFGQFVSNAYISVEPWKLLEALVSNLDRVSSIDRLAMKLIQEGPTLASKGSLDMIPLGQQAAFQAAKENEITVIWGPPGTGKTYTMSQIAIDGLKSGKSVLIVSHSNVSVDGVIKQTVESLGKSGMDDWLKEGRVLRYGYVRDEELSADPYAVAYNYVMEKEPKLKVQMDSLRKEKERLIHSGEYRSAKGEKIEKDLKELRALIRTGERQYVERAGIVATTISKVTVDPFFEDKKYDIVMFDEVSMAYVPQILCAAMHAAEKLVLVGDFRQLAPIVQSDARKVLGVDIFAYLGIARGTEIFPHPWLVMLNEQRRMCPAISAFPNEYVYHRLLIDHDDVNTNRKEIIQKKPLEGAAVNLIDLTGTFSAAMKNSDNSRFNILSAIIAFTTAIRAERDGEDSIGIITPYAAQTRLVRAMIQDFREYDETDVACSTVHQFQGSQRDLIIFDAVECYPAPKVGFLMGRDLNAVTRLINVAITRAKGKLIVTAHGGFWQRKFEGTPHIFYRLLKYLSVSGNVIGVKDKSLEPYVSELPSVRTLQRYEAWGKALDVFHKDVENAREKIVISIPDGQLDPEIQSVVFKYIVSVVAKGIRILCKSAGYADLPEDWKQITWGSENAVFPLIVIDDKTAWYGLLKSRGRFTDGNSGFVTVCQTIYRIRGAHTLEMIKTFSDLENRVVNDQRKPLLEKTSSDVSVSKRSSRVGDANDEDDGMDAAGLDSFVRRMEKCPKCKNPMMLARGKSGKCYMKCTSSTCQQTALLTIDFVNWYINAEHVTCPVHHCGIYAGLNKFGSYIKCDQGHFLKPCEI